MKKQSILVASLLLFLFASCQEKNLLLPEEPIVHSSARTVAGSDNDFDNDDKLNGVDTDDDNDGITDGADYDDDNDGILDNKDDNGAKDEDSDGIANGQDSDDDNDGIDDDNDSDDDNDGIDDDNDSDDDSSGIDDDDDNDGIDNDSDDDNSDSDEQELRLTQAQLPANVTTYLSSNYAGYTFMEAKSETKNSITKIEVKIRYNGKKWEVKFDGNGGFISAKKD
jgi:hypothetical protein